MAEQNEIEPLLAEIRDLLASREQQYKEHLANCETIYKEQYDAARKQAMINRPFQWGALFVVVYAAVYFALKTVG